MTSRERAQAPPDPAPTVPPPDPGPRYESIAAVAARLDVSPATVRRMVADGRLSSVRAGRLIRVRVDRLDQELHHDPGAAARAGRSAAHTRRPPAGRQPRGEFSRRASGLPPREPATPAAG